MAVSLRKRYVHTHYNLWAGSTPLHLDINDRTSDPAVADMWFRRAAKQYPYAEVVRRTWSSAPVYVRPDGRWVQDPGPRPHGRWAGRGCDTGCCNFRLTTTQRKG